MMEQKTLVDILYIEDNHDEAELAIRSLKKQNLANHLLHIDDGQQAVDFLFCKGKYAGNPVPRHLKLILLDLQLPKVNGLEILRMVKSDEKLRRIPVVILTSSKQESDLMKGYDLGANS